MLRIFKSFSDCGHGWAKVPRELLVELNILDKITSCSYQLGQNVYLEEDCDVSTFYDAYLAKTGLKPIFKISHSDKESKIRGYECFNANSAAPLASEIRVGMTVSVFDKQYEVIGFARKKFIVQGSDGTKYQAKLNQIRLLGE